MQPDTHSPEDSKRLYQQSGVDIHKADRLVGWLQEENTPASGPAGEVVAGIGGFASLFRPDFSGIADPLLVSATDGVGTKLLLALEEDCLEGLGQDLVAMCCNDLFTLGARPLFFLDYYATGRLSQTAFTRVLKGIRQALAQCQTALIGGETAELPGLYEKNHFDLAGFVVGVADGRRLPGMDKVKEGDYLLALPSSGFHSNGYSLIRHWLAEKPKPGDWEIREKLLIPTRIYSEIPEIWARSGPDHIHAMAHITGGGLPGNLVRVLPQGLSCQIAVRDLPLPEWMRNFWECRQYSLADVLETFNLGVGMVLVTASGSLQKVRQLLKESDLDSRVIGRVTPFSGKGPRVSVH